MSRRTSSAPRCKDCNGPIDEHTVKMLNDARARLGQPPKMPTRCARCTWNAIIKLEAEEGRRT